MQTTLAFQLHLQFVASLFFGMGPKVPAERLRQSLYTIRRTAKGEYKTIVLNRFGSADHTRIPIASSIRGFFVLRDGA